jgi:hypothetical protein
MRALARDPDKRYQTAREMGDELEALVVRERYSTRVFAKKARELLPEREDPTEAAAGGFGQKEAEIGVAAAAPARPSAAKLPPVPRAVPASPSAPIAVAPAAAPSSSPSPSRPPRWVWAAAGTPALAAVALLVVLLARPPAPPPVASVAAPAPPPSWTVKVALDSIPQGATVASVPAEGSEGKRFGETPVLLELPRGSKPVELLLTKAGFAPVTFRVIPYQDKDVVAPLERLTAPVVARATVSSRPAHGASSRRAAAPPPAPIAAAPSSPQRPAPVPARTSAQPAPVPARTPPPASSPRPGGPIPAAAVRR